MKLIIDFYGQHQDSTALVGVTVFFYNEIFEIKNVNKIA